MVKVVGEGCNTIITEPTVRGGLLAKQSSEKCSWPPLWFLALFFDRKVVPIVLIRQTRVRNGEKEKNVLHKYVRVNQLVCFFLKHIIKLQVCE